MPSVKYLVFLSHRHVGSGVSGHCATMNQRARLVFYDKGISSMDAIAAGGLFACCCLMDRVFVQRTRLPNRFDALDERGHLLHKEVPLVEGAEGIAD